jgi:hypothetical protein
MYVGFAPSFVGRFDGAQRFRNAGDSRGFPPIRSAMWRRSTKQRLIKSAEMRFGNQRMDAQNKNGEAPNTP